MLEKFAIEIKVNRHCTYNHGHDRMFKDGKLPDRQKIRSGSLWIPEFFKSSLQLPIIFLKRERTGKALILAYLSVKCRKGRLDAKG